MDLAPPHHGLTVVGEVLETGQVGARRLVQAVEDLVVADDPGVGLGVMLRAPQPQLAGLHPGEPRLAVEEAAQRGVDLLAVVEAEVDAGAPGAQRQARTLVEAGHPTFPLAAREGLPGVPMPQPELLVVVDLVDPHGLHPDVDGLAGSEGQGGEAEGDEGEHGSSRGDCRTDTVQGGVYPWLRATPPAVPAQGA